MGRLVKEMGIPYDSALLDHALSYLLTGISQVAQLRAHLVFKGGTALRKCFFAGYRYSEDLDFSTRDLFHWSADEFFVLLKAACGIAEGSTAQFGVYSFTPRQARHRDDHPNDQLDFRVAVVFPTGAENTIKIEVTQDEPIVRPIIERPILHGFEGEELHATIPVYGLDEIVVEKFRGFLQVRRTLETRSWTNRARDLYDVWDIHSGHHGLVAWGQMLEPLREKATAREVEFSSPDDFMAAAVLAAYRDTWDDRLENLVPGPLPDFDVAVEELRRALAEVFGTKIGSPAPTAA
jgi:hypothetical protein